jgi:hypothetical protein
MRAAAPQNPEDGCGALLLYVRIRGWPRHMRSQVQHRSFRIPDDLYKDALAAGRRNGESLTDVVRRCLRNLKPEIGNCPLVGRELPLCLAA